jgi:hypothetical protein
MKNDLHILNFKKTDGDPGYAILAETPEDFQN